MKIHKLSGTTFPLGFTFSFPCKQEGLAKGRLVKWTKGFCCSGVEGEDVVALLQEAIKRKVRLINPPNHHDASKHHFASHKSDLIYLN